MVRIVRAVAPKFSPPLRSGRRGWQQPRLPDLSGEIKMKQLVILTLILLIIISFLGCGIPDLPGPIGIPGL